MYNKKRILFISLGTCLLLFITAISFTYYHKNNIKKLDDFASYLENYKLELTNYSLIDNQENYDNLITKSEQSISNKNYKNINSLKSELNKLKEGILNKNNDIITNFSKYLDEYKNEISNYNLNDNQESCNNLISESEQSISDKNYKNVEYLTTKLNQLKEGILNKNIEMLNNTIYELESIDISKISDKASITTQFEQIKKLKDEKQFIKATELLALVKEDINNKLEIIKKEEEKINIEQTNSFTKRKALDYIIKDNYYFDYDSYWSKLTLTETSSGDFEFIPADTSNQPITGIYLNKKNDSSYEFSVRNIILLKDGKRSSSTLYSGYVKSDGSLSY